MHQEAKNVSQNTKQDFAKSIERLLKKKSLDDIQVSEIVAGSHLSRRTFYRHFFDKYDLANWYFDQFYQESFGRIVVGASWEEALMKCLEVYEQKQDILKNAYASKDINGLRNHEIEITRKIYETYLMQRGADIESEELRFSIEIAARGGTDMVIEWIRGGMKLPKKRFVELIKLSLPGEMIKFISNHDIE